MIETGLRKGEAAALQWPDINFKDQTSTVSKTMDFKEKTKDKLFGGTKNYNSRRTIAISKSLIRILQDYFKQRNQNKLALGDLYRHDLNLVLCRNDGNYMPKSSLSNAFKKILARMDYPQLPIHSLRHTHITLQMKDGADLKYIQERLGHEGIEITASVYAHLSKKLEEQQMCRFEEYTKDLFEQKNRRKKDGQMMGKQRISCLFQSFAQQRKTLEAIRLEGLVHLRTFACTVRAPKDVLVYGKCMS